MEDSLKERPSFPYWTNPLFIPQVFSTGWLTVIEVGLVLILTFFFFLNGGKVLKHKESCSMRRKQLREEFEANSSSLEKYYGSFSLPSCTADRGTKRRRPFPYSLVATWRGRDWLLTSGTLPHGVWEWTSSIPWSSPPEIGVSQFQAGEVTKRRPLSYLAPLLNPRGHLGLCLPPLPPPSSEAPFSLYVWPPSLLLWLNLTWGNSWGVGRGPGAAKSKTGAFVECSDQGAMPLNSC